MSEETRAFGRLLAKSYEDKYKRKASAENFLRDYLLSHDDNVSNETVRNCSMEYLRQPLQGWFCWLNG